MIDQENMDQWTVDPSRLKQDYDELKEQHETFTKLIAEKFMQMNRGLIKLQAERDEARREVERLQKYPAVSSAPIPIFGQLDNQAPKLIRPEPSRLEIAAMLYARNRMTMDVEDAVVAADALILQERAMRQMDERWTAAKEVAK